MSANQQGAIRTGSLRIQRYSEIGELQDGLYHKVIFEQKVIKESDDNYLEGSKKD